MIYKIENEYWENEYKEIQCDYIKFEEFIDSQIKMMNIWIKKNIEKIIEDKFGKMPGQKNYFLWFDKEEMQWRILKCTDKRKNMILYRNKEQAIYVLEKAIEY